MAQVSKLVVKKLGNPKVAASFTDAEMSAGKRHFLGTIMGIAHGLALKEDGAGKVYEQIIGEFEGTAAESGEVIQSGILYLPAGLHDILATPFRNNPKRDPIKFAVAVLTVRDTNPVGYSYVLEPLTEASEYDPLAELREAATKKLSALKLKALPKPA